MEPHFSTSEESALQLRLAKEEMTGTLYHFSSAAFLDIVIFPTLDQLSREMEKQIDAINNSYQSDTKVVINKGKLKKKLKKKARAAKKITFLQKNSSSSSSTASPDSSLASHAQKPVKPANSRSVIPPTRRNPKDDKGSDRSKKRSKLQDGFTGINNCIIKGYQPEHEKSQLLLDLIVYDIPAK
ncbi:hypothetical protein RCL_jg21477.t1 [Rhizophagus clarus]|uniref:Uncharacterized protein n=1 Tax=Rhizophagus clarus TaxID=94130 RepID=A0A8H3L482_9GLOM|nr:hypothetical protein RCL_jg21477.t1 [Rhizophagus clarus]